VGIALSNARVLGELSLKDEEIRELRAKGVVA